MAVRPPVLEPVAERRDFVEVILDISKECGALPKLPDYLYKAAEKAARTGDRIPYLFKLLAYAGSHMKYFDILPSIVGETFGRATGSVSKGVTWAALLTAPMQAGNAARANNPKLGLHPLLEKMPGMDNFCALDAGWEQVMKHPEGAVVAVTDYSDADKYTREHIHHKDHKIHLYCDTINEHIGKLTPENEEKALTPTEEFPFILSSGRHTEDGVNAMMRNRDVNRYVPSYYKLALNPMDMEEMGFEEGQTVRVTASSGEVLAPVSADLQVCRGYAMLPHHFGLKFRGETEGDSAGVVNPWDNMDEITGDPCCRYVPCRIEAV